MPVFFCYSHQDKDFVDRLAKQLVLRRAWVWVDRWELNVGDSIVGRVQEAIEKASAVVVVLSRSSVGSPWVQRELQSVIYREVQGQQSLVIPVVIEDCPIPPFLSDRIYADFRANFDTGLRVLVEGLSRVTSSTQGRIETPTFHTDWAVDWGDIDGDMAIRITMIDHSPAVSYSVLTTVEVIGNETATRRYRAFADRGLEWVQHGVVLEIASEFARDENIHFVLEDALPKKQKATLADLDQDVYYDLTFESRWVGTDTGKDVLIGLGDSLARVSAEWKKQVRPPTREEQLELSQLMRNLKRT